MTTATATLGNRTLAGARPSLEQLVDRLIAVLFRDEPETAEATAEPARSVARSVHEARRLRQAGEIDSALAVFGGMDMEKATQEEARWAFSEWMQLVRRRRFGNRDALVYSQGTGRAAALVPTSDGGTLEVAAVLGMRWPTGKLVSRRSLRGLKPLCGGG